MKHIDITIDLETLALSANAAILQIAAVAWNRDNPHSPFFDDVMPFEGCVDIRSCVSDNFDFEPRTIRWWSGQNEDVKTAVLSAPAHPLKDVLESLASWIDEVKNAKGVETVCLWAQGSDFDIAILRNAFTRYGIEFPIKRHFLRDARTFILETGARLLLPDNPKSGIADVKQIYSRIPLSADIANEAAHNAVRDARKTTWNVWWLMRELYKN